MASGYNQKFKSLLTESTGKGGATSSKKIENYVWQDREIRFDMPVGQLAMTKGEKVIDSINSVEDTKGNNGDKGNLIISNLRLIWFGEKDVKVNLSIGFDCILNTEIQETNSLSRGRAQALYLRTRFNGSHFQFIFTSLVKQSPRLFTSFLAVTRAYESTKTYRDLKLRCAIVQDKNLKLLPLEQVYNKYNGVWNLSAEQGNLGSFFVTNVRLVWFANVAENFNVSVPWIQISEIAVRESKFGTAMAIRTLKQSGDYTLGFKMENIENVFQEIVNLHKVYIDSPIFGVEAQMEEESKTLDEVTIPRAQDDVDLEDTGTAIAAASAHYYAMDGAASKEVVYSKELGLAIEKLPEGMTLEQLWKII